MVLAPKLLEWSIWLLPFEAGDVLLALKSLYKIIDQDGFNFQDDIFHKNLFFPLKDEVMEVLKDFPVNCILSSPIRGLQLLRSNKK